MKRLEDICRACLKSPDRMVTFEQNLTKTKKISECFQELTSINTSSSELQVKICQDCLEKLKISFEFKKKCLENDDKYYKLVRNWTRRGAYTQHTQQSDDQVEVIVVKNEIEDPDADIIDIIEYDDEKPVEVKEEWIEVEEEEVLTLQEAKEKETKALFVPIKPGKPLKCRFCLKVFTCKDARRTHRMHEIRVHIMKGHLPIEDDEEEEEMLEETFIEENPDETVSGLKCRFCPKVFTCKDAKRTLKNHELKVHILKGSLGKRKLTDKNECRFCGKVFNSKNAEKCVKHHEFTVHLAKGDVATLEDSEPEEDEKEIVEEESDESSEEMEGVEKCRFCKKTFTSKNAKRCVRNHEMLMHLIKGEVLSDKKVSRKSTETKRKVDFEYENESKEKRPKREEQIKMEQEEATVADEELVEELDESQFEGVTEEFYVEELEESVEDDSKIVEEDQEPQAYRCRFCDRLFETKHAKRCVKFHEMKVHLKELQLEKTQKLEKSEEFSCSFCGRIFTGKGAKRNCKCHELKMHIMKEEGNFICAYCPENFVWWADCNKHENQVHRKNCEFFCDLCGEIKTKKQTIRDHIHNHHLNVGCHVCKECESRPTFKSRRLLAAHKRDVHGNGSNFQCEICDQIFREKQYLKRHLEMHEDKKKYQCNICGVRFRIKFSLDDHIRTHNTENPEFECEKCHKKFQRLLSYRLHLRRHQRDEEGKTHPCPTCFKEFKFKNVLKAHVKRFHEGASKTFECTECDSKFYSKHHLTRHVLSIHMHSNFNCKLCGFEMRVRKDFQRDYKKHIKEAHSDLAPQQLVAIEIEIRKLRYSDVCPDLPAALICNKLRRPPDIVCQLCNIVFHSHKQINDHNKKFHDGDGSSIKLEVERLG